MKIWLNEKNEFVSLKMEQIKSLSEEDKTEYLEAKEMELKRIHTELANTNTTLKSELEALEQKHNDEITELKEQLRALAEKKDTVKLDKKEMGILEQLEAKKEEISLALKNRQPFELELDLKAAQTQTTSYTLSNGNIAFMPDMRGTVTLPYRPNVILDAVGKGSTNSKTVVWLEETLKEGSFAMTAEGGLKPLISETFDENTMSAKKIAGRKVMTTEQIEDLPQLTSIILSNLKRDHDKLLEEGVYAGDGTGNNFKGILEYAQTLVPTAPFVVSGTGTVFYPNLLDTIICANNQIEVASDGNYSADTVVLNPADYNHFKTLKDNTGNYVYPELATAGTLDGKRVAISTIIDQGKALVMDSSRANLLNYKPFKITFGYSSGDFENNRVSVIGESRNVFYISEEESKAFVYYDIATTQSTIAKP